MTQLEITTVTSSLITCRIVKPEKLHKELQFWSELVGYKGSKHMYNLCVECAT